MLLFSTSFLPIPCVKPSFGTPTSEKNLWFSPFSSLSKYPLFPWSYTGPLKLRIVRPLSDCSWWNPWPSLSEISFFHPPVFPAPRTTCSFPMPWLCYCCFAALYAGSYLCRPDVSHNFLASFFAFITSYILSFHHQVSLSPGDFRPAVMLNTSCPTLKIVVLLPPFLHTLHWSYFLQHRLPKFYFRILFLISTTLFLWLPVLVYNVFSPSLLLLMCQFRYPPTVTLSPPCVALRSWSMLPKCFFFILYTTHLWSISTHDVNHHLF